MSTVEVAGFSANRETLAYWGAILNAELLVLLVYFLFVTGPPASIAGLLIVVYPFVWLNVSWWAYRTMEVPDAPQRRKLVSGALAAGYFLLLAYVGGLLLPGIGDLAAGVRVVLFDQAPPGFTPAFLYSGELVVVNLILYQVIGYLTLGYLVYVTAIDVSGNLAAGVVGLFSCVSCTFPVIAAVVTGVTGSTAFAATVTQQSYGLSTVVFVVTVLLLRWRPTMADLARLRQRLRN